MRRFIAASKSEVKCPRHYMKKKHAARKKAKFLRQQRRRNRA